MCFSATASFGSGILLSAAGVAAFKKTGQMEKGELLLKAWRSEDEKNFLATWCLDVYRNMDAHTSVDIDDKGGRVVQAIFSLRP